MFFTCLTTPKWVQTWASLCFARFAGRLKCACLWLKYACVYVGTEFWLHDKSGNFCTQQLFSRDFLHCLKYLLKRKFPNPGWRFLVTSFQWGCLANEEHWPTIAFGRTKANKWWCFSVVMSRKAVLSRYYALDLRLRPQFQRSRYNAMTARPSSIHGTLYTE